MGILERLSTLIRANINDLLDQAEDPEIMLNQILRDMETEINRARSQVAEMMAQERLFRDDLQAEQQKSRQMEERAEYYVRQGNDTLAREALKRKADADSNISVLQQQLNAQSEMVQRLRRQLDALEEKYQQAVSNRDSLLARYRRAKTEQQVSRTMAGLDVTDYGSEFARMERRIREHEARVAAESELRDDLLSGDVESTFEDAERNMQIENELAAIKARVSGTGPGTAGTTGTADTTDTANS